MLFSQRPAAAGLFEFWCREMGFEPSIDNFINWLETEAEGRVIVESLYLQNEANRLHKKYHMKQRWFQKWGRK